MNVAHRHTHVLYYEFTDYDSIEDSQTNHIRTVTITFFVVKIFFFVPHYTNLEKRPRVTRNERRPYKAFLCSREVSFLQCVTTSTNCSLNQNQRCFLRRKLFLHELVYNIKWKKKLEYHDYYYYFMLEIIFTVYKILVNQTN